MDFVQFSFCSKNLRNRKLCRAGLYLISISENKTKVAHDKKIFTQPRLGRFCFCCLPVRSRFATTYLACLSRTPHAAHYRLRHEILFLTILTIKGDRFSQAFFDTGGGRFGLIEFSVWSYLPSLFLLIFHPSH